MAADRRGDRRIAQVDPRGFQRCGALRDRGARDARLRQCVGVILFGHRLHLGERFEALCFFFRRLRTRARARQIGRGLIDRRLVKARVDLEQRLAGAHRPALGKQALADDAVYLRPDFARFEGNGAAAERGGDRHSLLAHHDKADLRGTVAALVVLARTGAQRKRHRAQRSGKEQRLLVQHSLLSRVETAGVGGGRAPIQPIAPHHASPMAALRQITTIFPARGRTACVRPALRRRASR